MLAVIAGQYHQNIRFLAARPLLYKYSALYGIQVLRPRLHRLYYAERQGLGRHRLALPT